MHDEKAGPMKGKNRRSGSILPKLSFLVTALCAMIVLYSSYNLYLGLSKYNQAGELGAVRDAVAPFPEALKNFMFERGRMNVVLASNEPITQKNIDFLSQRRAAAEQAFLSGFSALEAKHPQDAQFLRAEYEGIAQLRTLADKEARKPLSQRDPLFRQEWFSRCTEYIGVVITRLKDVIGHSKSGTVDSYMDLVADTLHFRSIVGSESSILTSAVSGGRMLSIEEYSDIQFLRGQSGQIWANMNHLTETIRSDSLTATLSDVREQYYGLFRPEQDRVLALARTGPLPEGAGAEIARLSVPALDSILRINDEAIAEISRIVRDSLNSGQSSLLSSLAIMTASVLIAVFIPISLRRRLVRPLNGIIQVIEGLGEGKPQDIAPFVRRNDEIGKLGQGAQMLQDSMAAEQASRQKLNQAVHELEELSTKDSLTGLHNRRYLTDRFSRLEAEFKEKRTAFSVIMCDIDLFKSVNDRYGHECGDEALLHVTALLSGLLREGDLLARWGGEEFLFLLPGTDLQGARDTAENARMELKGKRFRYQEQEIGITMTFGVAQCGGECDIRKVIQSADMAMLKGKREGRDRVVTA